MIKHFCDMCNKEMKDSTHLVNISFFVGSNVKQKDSVYEVCPDCANLVRKYITEENVVANL